MKAFQNKKILTLLIVLVVGLGFYLKRTYKISHCQNQARELIEDHKKIIDIGAVLADSAKSAKLSEEQMALLRKLVLARHSIKNFDEKQIKSGSQMQEFNNLASAIATLKESSTEILKDATFFPTNTKKHTVPQKTLQTLWSFELSALHPEKEKAFNSCLLSK